MLLAQNWTLLLLAAVMFHVIRAPFTKVEESFNVQAAHDILYHGTNIRSYDHLQFPGVVPRTFLGAIALAVAAAPARLVASLVGESKGAVQFAMRILLGRVAVASLSTLHGSVHNLFGSAVAETFMLLTALQFHLPFYMSRPLPNVLAMVITNVGLANWLAGKGPYGTIALLTAVAVIFRCDAILLAGLVGLHLLATRKVTLLRGIVAGAAAAVAALALTVAVDSWFWRRWLWPEGEVLWFNTALNKSGEWGVSPPLWYFSSALPRALHASYPLAFVGALLDRRLRPVLAVALGFVALYSNLAHKELRFLFPVLPLWNIAAAAGLVRLWHNRGKSPAWRLMLAAALGAAIAGAAATALAAAASAANYPGGTALEQLHKLDTQQAEQALAAGRNLTVHIDVLPAMTGVTRFGELGRPWVYSKEEGMSEADLLQAGFDYLLSDKAAVPGYYQMLAVDGFAGIRLQGGSAGQAVRALLSGQLPVKVATAPAVYIHGRS